MCSELEAKNVVVQEISRCASLVSSKLGVSAPTPQIDWTALSGRILGRAWGFTKIDVNMAVARVLGKDYANTAGHEYAHILTAWLVRHHPSHHLLAGDLKGGHGNGWRNVMVFLGLEPNRCASQQVVSTASAAGAMGEVFYYGCKCATKHAFSKRRHNAVIRGQSYICRACRTALTFKEGYTVS